MKFFRIHSYAVILTLLCSCSSKLTYESCLEVNMPVEKTWAFFANPDNWLLWDESIEYFYCESEIQTGATIYAKLKNSNFEIPILLTNIEPYKSFDFQCKMFILTAKEFNRFEESEPGKTKITSECILQSCLLPFVRKKILNESRRQNYKVQLILDEIAATESTSDSASN